jgi:hypothetical protein
MKIQTLTIGMSVRHPQYGIGTVKTISEQTAEIRFSDTLRTVDPELGGLVPADATMAVSGLEQPLGQFVESTIEKIVERLGLEKPDDVVTELGVRWQKGKIVLHPSDPTLQTKEVPLEILFHKIVGIRNQLRVLEQKINAHTTFNLLFKTKEGQFSSKGE